MNLKSFKQTKFFAVPALLILLVLGLSGIPASAQKVRLRSQITPACTSTAGANLKFADIYADGNIAVQGTYGCKGVFIYNLSNPDAPVLSSWYNPGNSQQFLEAIVVGNRGYFGSGNGGGVHIVDLTNPASPTLLGTVTSANANAHNSIHEMVVFNQNGATYLIENFNSLSGNKILKVINVTNPAAPVFVRDINPTEIQWVHAMHIRGNRMFTSGWGNSSNKGRTEIYDISNIATTAPVLLGFIQDANSTTGGNSMHSSWTSEDGNYLYSCRETSNGTGDVRVYNIIDPANPLLVNSLTMSGLGLNAVTPHNPVVMGNKLYVAWYQAGLQVFDISVPSQPKRIGQYDTFQTQYAPEADNLNSTAAEPWDMFCGTNNFQNALPTSYDGNWAVYPFLGENKVLAGDLQYGLVVLDVTQATAPLKNTVSDFDGDGKTDYSVYTPSSGTWKIEQSSNNAYSEINFGLSDDKIVTGDYDGDGKSDLAIFRPSSGTWWIRRSSDPGNFSVVNFGVSGDVPVEADYDADGKTDIAVFRPSTGVWYIMQSTLGIRIQTWGLNGDKAFTGDFEGDGKADLAIFRPSSGVWYILQSSSNLSTIVKWGVSTDMPLSGDFDGDGKSDIAVFRPAEGNWYILNSNNASVSIYHFGAPGDIPIPSDFDGDSKADFAVFRPSENVWYRLDSSNNAFSARVYGQTGDNPSPSAVQPQ